MVIVSALIQFLGIDMERVTIDISKKVVGVVLKLRDRKKKHLQYLLPLNTEGII